MPMMAADKVCKPKSQGDLGLQPTAHVNIAF